MDGRYVGDRGAFLNIRHGGCAAAGLGASWRVRSLRLSLDLDALANTRSDRFAPLRRRNAGRRGIAL